MATFAEAESKLDLAVVPRAVSHATKLLISSVNLTAVQAQRRANYLQLSQALQDETSLQLLFPELPEGVVPFGLPVRLPAGQRDSIRAALRKKQIYCPVHWPVPKEAPAHELAGQILTLPIDQRYDVSAMVKLAEALVAVMRG